MKVLGITGGIGAGKSSVTRFFADLGAEIVDADKIAREILEPDKEGYFQVIEAFGKEILSGDGTINRKALAQIAFASKESISKLNNITHPLVFKEMKKRIEESKKALVCLDVPLLFSCDFPIGCDKTLAVIAQEEERIKRVMDRDGMTREMVVARISKQLPDDVLIEKADYYIDNNGNMESLRIKVEKIFKQVMENK